MNHRINNKIRVICRYKSRKGEFTPAEYWVLDGVSRGRWMQEYQLYVYRVCNAWPIHWYLDPAGYRTYKKYEPQIKPSGS